MKIWGIPVNFLCNAHLLGEHNELHVLWNVIVLDRKGWSSHPETMRWRGRLAALYVRHFEQVTEMHFRGWSHNSPLDEKLATGDIIQPVVLYTVADEIEHIRMKRDPNNKEHYRKSCKCDPDVVQKYFAGTRSLPRIECAQS